MKIFTNFEQRSLEWHAVRAGVVTASEIDALVSPEWKRREGKGVDSYLARKVAEKWIGGQLLSYQSQAMERGVELEEAGLRAFEKAIKKKVKRVGFVLYDDGYIGCSPDGLVGRDCGVELKCPNVETHVSYLLNDEIPKQYAAQVQFSMYVTGRKMWWFASYQPGFPLFLKLACANHDAFSAFDIAIHEFILRMDAAYQYLCDKNGGEPDKNTFRQMLIEQDLSTGTMEPQDL